MHAVETQPGDLRPLAKSVAVVTGGSEGIGLGIAEALAAAGAAVVMVSRRQGAVQEAEQQLTSRGHTAVGMAGDVRDGERIADVIARTESRFGGVDVLVNAAGGSFGDGFRRGPLLELDAEDLVEAYRLNAVGAFVTTKAVVSALRRRGGGSIVHISSIAAHHAAPGMGAYGAAKAGLNSLIRSLAGELAPLIRVNAVAPGHVDTPRTAARRDEAKRSRQLAETPMGRYGTPADVAGAVLYLTSPAASWVTGEVITVSGGLRGE